MKHRETVIILDFGSQYTQLIARRVRECGVYSEILPFDAPMDKVRALNPVSVILSGGPASMYEDEAPVCSEEVLRLGVPLLGICYGMFMLSGLYGGDTNPSVKREYGRSALSILDNDPIFDGIGKEITVWMSHGDKIQNLPPQFEKIGSSDNSEFAAIRHRKLKQYGLQFHPEVAHTDRGERIIENFVRRISGAAAVWTPAAFVEESITRVRKTVGDGSVLCAVSGGVDSTVMAVLLGRALKERVTCVLIDTGLMRQDEVENVQAIFDRYSTLDINVYNRSERFLSELEGVTDPEAKRKAIGRVFIEVFEDIARSLGKYDFLAQGTLYPDVIESNPVKGPSKTIKSHHNVGGLPEKMNFKLVEPLRELFKDEVRRVGAELGLPNEVIGRHPFPGPGLAVRILGEVTRDKLDVVREADAIFISELKNSGWYDKVWQALTVFLPVKTVGVMGDNRTYANAVALRAVTSVDGMTADWAKLPPELLGKTADRIINEIPDINRVVYDVSSKPPGTIEWE